MRFSIFKPVIVFILSLCIWSHASLAEDFIEATWPNMMRTMVRLGAIPLTDDALMDEYGIITECKLYESFYTDDFKWQKVRTALRASIKQNIATYPVFYRHDIPLRLDRYDFQQKIFRFTEKSSISNVNSVLLYSVSGLACGKAEIRYLPHIFRLVLNEPLYLSGLPMDEQQAKHLLDEMDQKQNQERFVYARLNFRIVYIEPLEKEVTQTGVGPTVHYNQPHNMAARQELRMDGQLDSIQVYSDQKRTRLVYEFRP